MKETTPQLFDHDRVRANRTRASRMDGKHRFLRSEIADRLRERLEEINRPFDHRLDIGGGYAPFLDNAASFKDQQPYSSTLLSGDTLNHVPALLPDDHFDLIVANLEFHWVNDLPGLLVQVSQHLNPDGLLLASLFGGETLHELRHSLLAAEVEITGGANARVIPFVDVRDAGSLLQRAGLALPVTDQDRITLTYEHPLQLMQELRGMGETNALRDRPKNLLRRDVLMRACEIYSEKFGLENGRIPATFDIIYLAGWRPHESQQKPLKPGTGSVNLGDALKAGKPPQS